MCLRRHLQAESSAGGEKGARGVIMLPGDAGPGAYQPAGCAVESCEDQLMDNNNVALLPRPPMQLEFKDITYTVSNFSITKINFVPKMILKGVDGCFRPGELTAIMGPSGAGKSTLLNILAGYVTRGAGGSISLNGTRQPAARSGGRGGARYIRQIDELRQYLTATEAGLFLAALRLAGLSALERREKVHETLAMLGLSNASQTLSRDLSGGQRRRLAVALELLSDPSILFLDEPTTGLDSASSAQLIALLSRLARSGRTLIATIHQPSALLFERLDAVHCLAEGRTLYRGARKQMMPALNNAGLRCPPYHNPADFLMEVASGDYNVDLVKLSGAISQDCPVVGDTSDNNANNVKTDLNIECDTKNLVDKMKVDKNKEYSRGYRQAGLCMQTWLLLYRSFLMTSRNYNLFLWRIFAHLSVGFLFGYLYMGVGATADQMMGNYVYLYGSMLFVSYTGKMAVTLCFPLEVEILKVEHFNRWYKLGPYIISILAVELPFQVLCCVAYFIPSFWLTANLPEFNRMAWFLISISLSSLCAQAWGYLIGATMAVKIAVFVGPVLVCLQSVFGFCLSLRDTPFPFRWLHHVSFFRAGFHVVVFSVYGLNRDKMSCHQMYNNFNYCHYAFPTKFLKEMDVLDINIVGNLVLVGGTIVVMHVLACFAIWWKLNKR